MTPTAMLQELERWRDAGWLRSLDTAFARFMHETDPRAPASLLLAAALLARLEGSGHSALPLAELAADPVALLGWPPESAAALCGVLADWPGAVLTANAGAHPDWQARPLLEVDPPDDNGASPLVLYRGLLYLRRYWRYESRVAAQVHARTGAAGDAAAARLDDVDPGTARELLDTLFGVPAADGGTDWQKVACAVALRGRLTIITGGPGTGKTYTAARLLVLLQALHGAQQTRPQALRVALAAPTGKAAARLRQSIQKALQGLRDQPGAAATIGAWADHLEAARTLHALLGAQPGTRRFRHSVSNPLDVDVLFVDEASMVHLELMAQLLEALPVGARVVLLGDKDQLASVEAGAVMGDLCQGADRDGNLQAGRGDLPAVAAWVHQVTGQTLPASSLGSGSALAQQTVVLRHSHRFAGPIGQLALAINQGNASAAAGLLRAGQGGPLAWLLAPAASALLSVAVHGRTGAPGGYRAYLELVSHGPAAADAHPEWARQVLRRFDSFRVLSALRDGPWGVAGLNAAIERALLDAGLLRRQGEWYPGRPVIVTRNDAALGVFNGDVGVVLPAPTPDAALRCYFLEGDGLRSVSVGRLADVATAFAMTVHKSQGSEFDHVLLVLPDADAPVLTRELLYTGVTRASKAFTLASSGGGQFAAAVGRLTQRVSGLRSRLP
jgi:exodeoxyribonuclease V alpha subunit